MRWLIVEYEGCNMKEKKGQETERKKEVEKRSLLGRLSCVFHSFSSPRRKQEISTHATDNDSGSEYCS